MAIDWPAASKTQQVTAASAAGSVALLSTTREIIIVNLSANGAYVNVNGTATAGSGSHFVPGTVGFERVLPVGNSSTLSHIRSGGSDATLEITEVG